MGHGMKSYSKKQKRAMRRRNHIALDLADEKYRQRVLKNKRKEIKPDEDEWRDADDDFS